ncbi:leucine--tRNA ligase [Filimonas effusa]|uniref:Leucine--tRNA ligase n=1 Tax=Filimonas effusa TaxID=2508721 RepID=A0A4Q1D6M5_9BACT|nr:leucine--tRNA ligase [Filimonas effusa]RXK83361.1 leucine--tRNA ligase [Filimonas effusa]
MEYNFRQIEKNWQEQWNQSGAYKVQNISPKPKYYVLDMFPYPSGAGLHVGHPLGYISSDIFARFKRLKGFNVLHPMGYDAFGLPAEQYAIENGVHPAVSTNSNIANFRRQLDNIGFCFDWSREIRTSDPGYYKWTQWIFLQLFNSFFDRNQQKAIPITELVTAFEKEGNKKHPIPNSQFEVPGCFHGSFNAAEWTAFDEFTQQSILMEYRLAFCGYGEVNWCEALGTVLANDEVVNGVSERGGHPVVKKKLRQWYLRITEYADRLLEGLDRIEFSDAMKEMQTNWIGKSYGAEIDFQVKSQLNKVNTLKVYTTRPDTIFGVDFMVVAPELEWVEDLKSDAQAAEVDAYIAYVKSRSDRERQAEKKISGCFTGAYAINPFNGREIPVWISEYVLAGYGTGAIMAVPCGDERDFKFAQHFNIPITNIIGDAFNGTEANATKEVQLSNSGFLDGTVMRDAMNLVLTRLEEMGIGKRKVNYRMRDAAFSRQRYWGEPFPIQWINGIAYPLKESELPLELPHIEKYGPGPEGEGPLANVPEWTARHLETNTMPGYAGSSWYFLRYMDPHNNQAFCDRKVSDYWGQVDLYIGGTEHAVGHLLYSRMWTKVLYDLGFIGFDEPYKKLVNQGMIQGSSRFVYRIRGTHQYVSAGLIDQYEVDKLHVDVNIVDGVELDTEAFTKWKPEFANATFILENGKYICATEVEKMSKSKFNTVNPDDLVEKYGADTFRMYEMFLGPVEQSKPWDTKGIEGVHRFLRKLWRLFYDEVKGKLWNNSKATDAELKVLHKTIRKIEEDTERFSFNTAVSAFMVCVNELSDLKCNKQEILEALLILLTPYAPHICEQLWHDLGHTTSILDASYPVFEEKYVKESAKEYPISINGKVRTSLSIDLSATQPEVEQIVLANEVVQKWVEGKEVRKFIYVPNKMINVVV